MFQHFDRELSEITTRLFLPTQVSPVESALRGYVASHGEVLEFHEDPMFVSTLTRHPSRTVGLVSGGGSGHEPLHVGFVGRGGLDAAVPGLVFASPHNAQVLAASEHAAGRDGVLLIIKNYTGDRIHFGIAAERLAAQGVPVAQVIVDDDVATESAGSIVGRRGTGATVVVEKILGARADQGATLVDLQQLGARVVSESRSLAVATGPLTSFASGECAFEIAAGTTEFGIGIHGEPAPESIPTNSLEDLVSRIVERLLASLPSQCDRVLAVVNGLGSATPLELGAVMQTLEMDLDGRGVKVDSAQVGTFVSALDMRGFMITLTASNDEFLELWLADAQLPGFPATSLYKTNVRKNWTEAGAGAVQDDALLAAVLDEVVLAHSTLTKLDQLAGDGDFGDNLLAGVRNAARIPGEGGLDRLTRSFLDTVGGSSGPLLGLLLNSIGDALAANSSAGYLRANARDLRDGILQGSAAIQRVGGARPGDRTIVDALEGVSKVAGNDVLELIDALISGARSTGEMHPRMGRASYVGDRATGIPDAGAVGAVVLLTTIISQVMPEFANDCTGRTAAYVEELASV